MADRVDWSDEENSVLVGAYLDMLRSELADEAYVKAVANRQLQGLLNGRSRGSIEFKLANVSAVLREMNFPFINGYKPRPNIQASLRDSVRREILEQNDLTDLAFTRLTETMPDALQTATWHEGPLPDAHVTPSQPGARVGRWNFVELEAMNRELGASGERAVVVRERKLLADLGEHRLADRVEHVSQTVGDGLGFDIRSFEPDGTDKLIEVKTTRQGSHWPMLVSRNEVDVSAAEAERYHLYRLHDFRPESIRFYVLQGDLRSACDLRPETYKALPARSSIASAQSHLPK